MTVRFLPGDAHALEFPDRSFDVVVSLRLLMHTPEWRTSIAEMCRVADQMLILDYPARCSGAFLQSAARRFTHAFGMSVEPYRVFGDGEIEGELRRRGFRIRCAHRQFVLPIAFHKAIGSRRFTLAVERALERARLLRVFGSPVTLVADRCASS